MLVCSRYVGCCKLVYHLLMAGLINVKVNNSLKGLRMIFFELTIEVLLFHRYKSNYKRDLFTFLDIVQ